MNFRYLFIAFIFIALSDCYSQGLSEKRGIWIGSAIVGSFTPMKLPEAKEEKLLCKLVEFSLEKHFEKFLFGAVFRAMEASELKWNYSVTTSPLNIDHDMYDFGMRRLEFNVISGFELINTRRIDIIVQGILINAIDRESADQFRYVVNNGVLTSGEVHTSKTKTYYDLGAQGNMRFLIHLSKLIQLDIFSGFGIFTDTRQRLEIGIGTKFTF